MPKKINTKVYFPSLFAFLPSNSLSMTLINQAVAASYEHEANTPHDFFMSGVCKKVEVTEDWRLIFESNLDIEQFWTAEINDKEEIDLGFNPLLADTDAKGIIDSEHGFISFSIHKGIFAV